MYRSERTPKLVFLGGYFDWQMQCVRSEIRNSQKGVIDQRAISGETRIASEITEVGKAEMIIQWVGDADSWMSGEKANEK